MEKRKAIAFVWVKIDQNHREMIEGTKKGGGQRHLFECSMGNRHNGWVSRARDAERSQMDFDWPHIFSLL